MKIICIGRNYADHAKELKNDLPTEPVIFMKPQTALLTPGKPFYFPDFTKDLHYECEVVVKIEKKGRYVQEKFAHKYYSEITLGIDFTARDLQREQQKKGLPWEIAKAFDGSAAIGTFVKLDNNRKIEDLHFQLRLNDAVVQDGHTRDLIFDVNKLIAYASQFFSLNVGDLIYTGTPAGVGPLKIGDRLEGTLSEEKLLEVTIQ